MRVRYLLILPLLLFTFLFLVQPVNAQVRYEDVVEKIRYTHPNRMIGPEGGTANQPFDAKKEIGPQNPVLKVYIWADLGERFTKKFFDEAFESLKNKYSQEALFIYNHRAFLMQDTSVRAGMIGECTAKQGQFWTNINPIMNNVDNLDSLDYLQNVDRPEIEKCLKNPYTKSVIDISEEDGKYSGFNSIPTVVIQNIAKPQQYSIKVSGAQELSIFERAFLEAEEGDLNKKDLEEIKTKVTELQQDVQQTKEDVRQVKTEQSRLAQEIEKLKELIQSILEQIKSLFGVKSSN